MILNILSKRNSSRKLTYKRNGRLCLIDIQHIYQFIFRSAEVRSVVSMCTKWPALLERLSSHPLNSVTGSRPLPLVQPRRYMKRLSLDQVQTRNTLYDVLRVPTKATKAEIKAAYYKLSMTYHPDTNKDEGSAEKFRKVSEAYEILGNTTSRRRYDKGLLTVVKDADGSTIYTGTFYPGDHAEDIGRTTAESRFRSRVPIHYGRTSAYNFDEWTKFHYGQTFYRTTEARRENERKAAAKAFHQGRGSNEIALGLTLLTLMLATITLYVVPLAFDNPDYDNVNQKLKPN